jgi:hypothetical protein
MSLVQRYNGKPTLVTASAKFLYQQGAPASIANRGMPADQTSSYPFVEIDFDVRRWALLARTTLVQLKDRVRDLPIKLAFMVEGTKDDELPERVLGCLSLSGLHETFANKIPMIQQ